MQVKRTFLMLMALLCFDSTGKVFPVLAGEGLLDIRECQGGHGGLHRAGGLHRSEILHPICESKVALMSFHNKSMLVLLFL